MDKKKKFSVIGIPVKHSLSPQIHKEFAKQQGINIQYKMIEPFGPSIMQGKIPDVVFKEFENCINEVLWEITDCGE